jgi:hypothetical protein
VFTNGKIRVIIILSVRDNDYILLNIYFWRKIIMNIGTALIYLFLVFAFMFLLGVCGWFTENTKVGSKLTASAAKKFFGIDVNELED